MIILARKSQDHDLSSRCRDLRSLRCGRRVRKVGRDPGGSCWKFLVSFWCEKDIRYQIIGGLCLPSFSFVELCALPTWWFWRGGCTRSHSEHGRETPQRRWYSDLSHGRVGRCQVCKTQNLNSSQINDTAGNDRTNKRAALKAAHCRCKNYLSNAAKLALKVRP